MTRLKTLLEKLKNEKILFLLVALFFGLEYFILGPFSYVRLGDVLDSWVPRNVATWQALFSGDFGYWQTFLIGGTDRMSNIASFNELANLLFIFPGWLAMTIAAVGGFFFGGYYLFRLSHEILGFGKKASAVAGILFILPFIDNYPPYTFGIVILPFVLFYLEKIFFSQKLRQPVKILFFLILGVAYSFFSSLSLTLPFVSIIIILWFWLIRKQKKISFYALLILFFVPAVLLKSQEALALLASASLSTRGAGEAYFKVSLKHYFSAITGLFKIYYPTIIVSLLGLFFVKKDRLFLKLFIFSLVLIFIPKAYITIIAASDLGKIFGPFRNFDFSRFFLLIPFFSALAAGCALQRAADLKDLKMTITSPEGEGRIFKLENILLIFCLVLIFIPSISVKEKIIFGWLKNGSYRVSTYSPDITILKKNANNNLPFRVASLSPRAVKSFLPSLPNFHGLETVDGYADVGFQRTTDVFRLMAEDKTVKSNLYFLMGVDSRTALELADDFDPAKLVDMNLLSLLNTRYIITDNLIDSPDLKLVDTPSSKDWRPWNEMSEIEKINFLIKENFTGRKLLVYENKNAFPRFFLAKKVKVFATEQDLLSGLATTTTSILRQNVFLVKSDADKLPKLSGKAEKIEIVKYSNDEIKLRVESDGPSVLVVSNNFSPFWEAYVNGEKKEIMPAYHALWGLLLTATSSEVDFVYNPPYKMKPKIK
jgi:hypothetical protein